MAIVNTRTKQFIEDKDTRVSVGIDFPFARVPDQRDGYFKTTKTTIESVKNNIKLLLQTQKGERLMQPNLGLNLRKYLFEQITMDTKTSIEADINDTFNFWLPFVEIIDLNVNLGEDSDIGRNQIDISLTFRINKDPNSQESVQLSIGGE